MKLKLFSILNLFVLALIIISTVQAEQLTYQVVGDSQLDVIVEKAMKTHNVLGASGAVVKDGAVAWAKGYGMADPKQNLPVTSETVFEAASVSKTVTAGES